jgi:hypothetical protein
MVIVECKLLDMKKQGKERKMQRERKKMGYKNPNQPTSDPPQIRGRV